MAKKKKQTNLTAEFWRKDAEQRANADRILEAHRLERERELSAHRLEAMLRRLRRHVGRVIAG